MTLLFSILCVCAALGIFTFKITRATDRLVAWLQALDVVLALGFGTLALWSYLS